MSDPKSEFMLKIMPWLTQLLDIARHDLRYHMARGELQEGDLTEEEIVGETLIVAFNGRSRKPRNVSWRLWLFRLEDRIMHRLIGREEKNRSRWAFSMDEPIPDLEAPLGDDVFWDWYQPDEKDRWEDVLCGYEPLPEELIAKAEKAAADLEPPDRRAWLLHGKFNFTVPEVAQILQKPPSSVAKTIRHTGEKLKGLVRVREKTD
ncbi:MAG: sigma-70 family RNA polymerase sigma factor [Proteobacteria bacterium]|nr:sigma-70 family RNA polymerase sigma factor [Pseudomonadota bacterium]